MGGRPMHTGPEAHFTERLRGIWSRRKWLAAIVFALTATVGVTLALSLPDMYRATATVLVEDSRVEASVAAELDRRLQLISQEILSRSRLDVIIRRFGLYPELRGRVSPQVAVNRMRRDIQTQFQAASSAGNPGGTITIAVSYRGTNPGTVTHVANALAGLYLEEDGKIRERQARRTGRWPRSRSGISGNCRSSLKPTWPRSSSCKRSCARRAKSACGPSTAGTTCSGAWPSSMRTPPPQLRPGASPAGWRSSRRSWPTSSANSPTDTRT